MKIFFNEDVECKLFPCGLCIDGTCCNTECRKSKEGLEELLIKTERERLTV